MKRNLIIHIVLSGVIVCLVVLCAVTRTQLANVRSENEWLRSTFSPTNAPETSPQSVPVWSGIPSRTTPPVSPNFTPSDAYEAAAKGDITRLKAVLDRQPELIESRFTKYGDTPLLGAVFYGKVLAVEELLRRHANVNVQNKGGTTPLHQVVNGKTNSQEILVLLLSYNPDVMLRNRDGNTPLQLAVKANRLDLADTLSQAGAKE